jgi:immune inhibitor A
VNKRHWSAASGLAVGALVVSGLALPMSAQAASGGGAPTSSDPAATSRPDDLPNPLADAAAAERKDAVAKLVRGEATTTTIGGNRVIEVKSTGKDAKGRSKRSKFINYPVQREEDIFTILVDFGSQVNPSTGGTAGPVHNQIPKPDRTWDGNATDDNSTYWVGDFNQAHYKDLMFGAGESFKDFYQSNGRFLAKGDVSDWVKVPYNEARYGSNSFSDSQVYWPFIKDTGNAWYDAQKAAGKSDAEIKTYLAQFDKVDRYDYDHDGNFNEPDGYIDHFQAIHAGEGEEAGGGAQGADAIWSHRWYAYSNGAGRTGPAENLAGGTQIGNTGIWIGDYTTEPENGGLGVFAHEFGHDLGLPDLYDTAGGDNGTGFWTLMSGGSWLNHGTDSIGTTPGYMGAWEKLQLGWLDYKTVPYGTDTTVKLGPADKASRSAAQAIVVPLPDRTVTTEHNTPHSGTAEWWSGLGDNLNATLGRSIDLTGQTAGSVGAYVQGGLEVDYDYLYAEVSTNGGTSWTQVGDAVNGIFPWQQKTWDLSAYAGQNIQFRFRVATDGGVASEAFLDDIAVTVGGTTTTDDVEAGACAWTASGFSIINGTTSRTVQDIYLAENRVYSGYDSTLRTGPYNFGFSNTRPDWSSASRTRTGCSSPTRTASSPTTTPPPTPVVARCCPSTRGRRR